MRLKRDGPNALYAQLAERLRQLVHELPEGARIPTERELVTQYGVSKPTVRRAVDALVIDGLLVRRPPKGTFVTRPRLRQTLGHVGAFLDTLSVQGRQPTPTLAAFTWVSDPKQLPDGLPDVTETLYFERLYTLDDEPCAFAQGYIPYPFGANVSRNDLETHPSFEVLTHKLGLAIEQTRVTIRATLAGPDQATRLGITAGSPLVLMHRWLYATGDQLIQYVLHYLPADRFELELKHLKQAGEAAPHPTPHAVLSLVPPASEAS